MWSVESEKKEKKESEVTFLCSELKNTVFSAGL